MTREQPDDETLLFSLARTALSEGREAEALPVLRTAAAGRQSARLWQWTGLLERALEDHQQALLSFERAAVLDPKDGSIAHGRARVALEAGVPAGEFFNSALRLLPSDGDVLLGYAAAMFADGHADAAEKLLDHMLVRSPFWIEGHMQLAQLRSTMGKKDQATSSLERSLKLHPAGEQLWIALFRILLQAEKFPELDEAVAQARQSPLRADAALLQYETIAAVERRQVDRADRLFGAMPQEMRQALEVWRIRHLLRTGRIDAACRLIDAALSSDRALTIWPYAAIAWRLAGDPRWEWLEGDLARLVSVIDLSAEISDIGSLEQSLRQLHAGKGEFLDQSVRGGSQTDGPLFTKVDPQIRALRAIIVGAVRRHIGSLPPVDTRHPLLGLPRDRNIGFSGSWSVLLRSAGFHANHVHPEGWISSALYIHLPTKAASDPPTAGWLTLGEPQAELGLELEPLLQIEPKPGRLILFPSYTWHGTRPFSEGERLTVAFDVRRPI